jgi:GNAT superfamily N-acetyltransferase
MTRDMEEISTELILTRVEQYSSRRFREAMQIYMAEFSDTRLSLRKVRALLTTGRYQLWVTQDASHVLAMALLWVCDRCAFIHLDYIAVEHTRKGLGVGTTFYRWLIAHMKDLCPSAQLMTLEVEDSLLGFYRRSQTQLLQNVPYLFPGSPDPVPMNLMVYDSRGRKTVSRAMVQTLIRALYRGIHNRGADDAVLRSFIARVPRRVVLV